MAGWFDRFPAKVEYQEDAYLLDRQPHGLSVKIRGGRAFEVKAYRGSSGTIETTGRARGRMESWQKWRFPVVPLSEVSGNHAGWRLLRKKRRISQFWPAGGRLRAVPNGAREGLVCAVELTDVRVRDEPWWTLGFEAAGPASLLRSHLEVTAACVFAKALPEGLELGTWNSMSYVEWLQILEHAHGVTQPG